METEALSSPPLTLGILKTDSVRPEFVRRHGDYPAMFRALFMTAIAGDVSAAGRPLEFRDYDVQAGEYPQRLDSCDAYLITGSRDSVYEEHDWIRRLEDFVRELHAARHKLVGICFGHQLVAQALGGLTTPAPGGWAVGVHASRLLETPSWLDDGTPEFALLSSHKDQVERLPATAQLLASNGFCPFAAFTVADHILCFQGHPEFGKPYARDLMDHRRDLLGEAVHSAGLASLQHSVHSIQVARWILAFIEHPRAA